MAKISKSYILTPPHPQGHVMSVKCEQPIDELTVQVWLLYHNPNFKYCTLFVSRTGRNYGRTNRQTDKQTDGRTDDPNTRCPRRTFQAGGIKNLTTEWNQKQQHSITHASRSLLWIRFVAVAFQSEEEVFLRRGPPVTYFAFSLDPPLGKYGQNIFMHVPGHEHFIPTKFRKHPLSGSVVKAGYVFPYIYMH